MIMAIVHILVFDKGYGPNSGLLVTVFSRLNQSVQGNASLDVDLLLCPLPTTSTTP